MFYKNIFYLALSLCIIVCSCSWDPFSPHKSTFNVTVQNDGSGTIDISPSAIKIPPGSIVTLTAVADSGYMFIGYGGDIQETSNPFSITINSNMSVIARFVKRPRGSMVEIPANGASFDLGSNAAIADGYEKNVHTVSFTYNYMMDRCEITQGQFSKIMGYNPVTIFGGFGVGDSFPVYWVSWYEAALFCNARSKIDGYDTVYSYTAKCSLGQNCPYVLENIKINYEHTGYRLPTEAEWEFACRAKSTTDYYWGSDTTQLTVSKEAWTPSNSQNATHPVGQILPNGYVLFDMAGNVSEFVNDWLALYPKVSQINPVGPTNLTQAQFEDKAERPLRGGCFELGINNMRSSSRLENYKATAKTISKHVGFRTVVGVFYPDTVSYIERPITDSLQIAIDCKKSDLLSKVKATGLKIAFVKDFNSYRKLCYIDFSEPTPIIREIRDSIDVHGATISPNGKFIAYGSKFLSQSGKSQMTIRRLSDSITQCSRTSENENAFLPTWWTDTIAPDTFVVYSNGASSNESSVWKSEKTMMQKYSNFALSGNATVLTDSGSFTGGLSKKAQYFASGFTRGYLYDRKNNDLFRYFVPPFSGRDDSGQVCNVSINPGADRPDELLFLDFGYSKTNSVVGKSYGIHDILFRANSQTTSMHHIVKWYEVPGGYREWNDVRWSNHPDFAVAIANDQKSGTRKSIFIINLKDSLYLKVATGEGLSEPYLWINPAELFEKVDPYIDFAKYEVAYRVPGQLLLSQKLRIFWQQRNNLQVAITGSSPAFYGIDPAAIKSYKAINMATLMGEMLLSDYVSLKYVLAQAPNFKALVLTLDPGFLDIDPVVDAPFLSGLTQSDGYVFDKQNNFWQSGVPALIKNKIDGFNASSWPDLDSVGCFKIHAVFGGDTLPRIDGNDYQFTNDTLVTNLSILKSLSDTLGVRGIHVFMVECPENARYKSTSFIGRYGPSRATYTKISQWLKDLEKTNKKFHFYDANNFGNHDYVDEEFLDPNHLSYLGSQKLSHRIDSLLQVYVK